MPENNFHKNEDIQFGDESRLLPFLRRLNNYAWRYPQWMWRFIFCTIIVGISDAIWPLIWNTYLDHTILPLANKYGHLSFVDFPWNEVILFPVLFLVNGIVQVIAVYFFIVYTGYVKERVLYDLRQEMFEKIQYLSFSYYDKVQTGWLLSRVNTDSERLSDLISWGFLELIWGTIMLSFSILFLFFSNWKLGLILLASIPLVILVSYVINRYILAYSRKARKLNSEMTASFAENINGILVNKSLARADRVTEKFSEQGDRFLYYSVRAAYYSGVFVPAVILIGTITAAVMLQVGGYWASLPTSTITIGGLSAAMLYATRVFIPMIDIAKFYGAAHNSMSAGERVFQLLDEPLSIIDVPGAKADISIKGDILFEQVCFSYQGNERVLDDLTLKIKSGESIALVGPSGQGKTTIVSLLSRFYEPSLGTIYFNGTDYRKLTQQSLRTQIGIVLQKPHLFEGSLLDNLRFANKDLTEAEAYNTLVDIGAEKLALQLNDSVGESGENLSLGEKQIVSIARVILLKPALFILDEATSSIDPLSELIIQKGLEKLMMVSTSILIAHRLSTITNCDRILYIEKGKIIEDGSHKQLMHKKGKYFQLYIRQITEQRMEKINE